MLKQISIVPILHHIVCFSTWKTAKMLRRLAVFFYGRKLFVMWNKELPFFFFNKQHELTIPFTTPHPLHYNLYRYLYE